MRTLDHPFLSDLAFLRDPNCLDKEEGFCDISFPDSLERSELPGSSFTQELLPEQLPERVSQMSLMKRVMIGGIFLERTPTIWQYGGHRLYGLAGRFILLPRNLLRFP
jgi:hypothetical protein